MRTTFTFFTITAAALALSALPPARAHAQTTSPTEGAPATTATVALTPSAPSPPAPTGPVLANFGEVSVMGFAGFVRQNIGSFEFHYEHVFAEHHGVQLSGDFIHVHHNSPHLQSHQWTYGGSVSYRYYFGPARGPFVGAQFGYRRGHGHFEEPTGVGHTALTNEQIRGVAQVGYRFVIPGTRPSFTLVPRLGVGYGPYTVRADASHHATVEQMDRAVQTSQDILGVPGPLVDLELSFGAAF